MKMKPKPKPLFLNTTLKNTSKTTHTDTHTHTHAHTCAMLGWRGTLLGRRPLIPRTREDDYWMADYEYEPGSGEAFPPQ